MKEQLGRKTKFGDLQALKKCSGQKVSLNQAAFKCVSQTAPNPFPRQLQYFPSPCTFSMHQAMEYARRHLFSVAVGQMRAMLIFFSLLHFAFLLMKLTPGVDVRGAEQQAHYRLHYGSWKLVANWILSRSDW